MKQLFTSLFASLVFICFSSLTSFAQEGQIELGAGLLYGSQIEELGIQVNGSYRLNEEIELAPDVSLFFVDEDRGLDSYWAINLNGHYIFMAEDEYNAYGIGGINITFAENSEGFTLDDESDTELGLNVGAGGEYYLDSFSLYAELKYIISDFDGLVIGAGIRLPLDQF